MSVIARFVQWACPNGCGNGVSRSDQHPTWHCWRCHIDAVEVEYVTLRAVDHQRVVSDAVALVFLANLHDDELDDAAQRQLEALTEKYVPAHPSRGR